MKEIDEDITKLKSLLDESKNRQLTKDEIETLFKLTRNRIKKLEKKAKKRLAESKKKKKLNKKENSAGSGKTKE